MEHPHWNWSTLHDISSGAAKFVPRNCGDVRQVEIKRKVIVEMACNGYIGRTGMNISKEWVKC
jgi:hypothetical protein